MQTNIHTPSNLPRGWRFRETPGHGYLIPAQADNDRVPAFIRNREYEEDCAFTIPIVFNPHLFTDEVVTAATDTFKNWFPHDYERAFNTTLQPGESTMKDDYFFKPNANIGKYTPNCAWGDWHEGVPKGMVLVSAGRVHEIKRATIRKYDDDEKYFLIPKEEYTGGGMYFAEDAYTQVPAPAKPQR